MDPVVHFEMGYFDSERMKKFYESAFGWKLNDLGPEMGNYVMAETTDSDENGIPNTPGCIHGGFYQKNENPATIAPSFVISVSDIQSAMKAVVSSGGKILGASGADGVHSFEPMMIPGIGLWISIQDSEENRVSLLQRETRSNV